MPSDLRTQVELLKEDSLPYQSFCKKYGVPLRHFGKSITIQKAIAKAKPEEAEKTIAEQVRKVLSNKTLTFWESWFESEDKTKIQKLHLDLTLPLNPLNPKELKKIETWLGDCPIKIEHQLWKDFLKKSCLKITKGKWGPGLDGNYEKYSEENALASAKNLWNQTHKWTLSNEETQENRLKAIQEYYPSFNIKSSVYSVPILNELITLGFYQKMEMRPKKTEEAKPRPSPKLIILGEDHTEPESTGVKIALLKTLKKEGFEIATWEEPEDISWKPIWTLLWEIGRKTPVEEYEEKAIEICQKLGLDEASAGSLATMAAAKKLGYTLCPIDIKRKDKYKITQTLKENSEKRIAYGEEFNPTKLSSVFGGPKVLWENILESYNANLERSKTMAQRIWKVSRGNKIPLIHIGGKLHVRDIQKIMESNYKTQPLGIYLKYREENQLILALKKTLPQKGDYYFELEVNKSTAPKEIERKLQKELNINLRNEPKPRTSLGPGLGLGLGLGSE